MRQIKKSLDYIKKAVAQLKGKDLSFVVNKGRNKFITFDGKVVDAYDSIFTVVSTENFGNELYTFSYNDVACKTIKILPPTSN
ncbi:MAG: Veg family protein [Christensenellales bacterium]